MFDYFCPVWDGLNNGLRDKLTDYGLRNIENKLAMPNSCTAAMRHNCLPCLNKVFVYVDSLHTLGC